MLAAPQGEGPSSIDLQDLGEPGCYQEGESILSWLNRANTDSTVQHKKTEILDLLAAKEFDAQTLMDIGDHVATPLEVHLLLAVNEDPDVRFALAENHNVPESVLKMLVEDSNPYVAYRAQKTLAKLDVSGANLLPLVRVVPPV